VNARFDLLVTGGEVLDPGAGIAGRLDLGVRDGRIAAAAPGLPRDAASEVVEADGLTVVPGLVDLHTHVLHGLTAWGVDAGALAPRSGVTPPPLVAPDDAP
jgi:dihydroorotase